MAAREGKNSGKAPASGGGDYGTAFRLLEAGKVAEAEVILRKVLTSDPDDAGALHLLGGIALGKGQTSAAEELVRKAIRFSPRTPEYHDNLGAVLMRQGKTDEAEAAFRTAIEIDPGAAMTHNNLGNALKQKGDFTAAAAAFRRVIELDPDIAEIHSNLGTALRALGRWEEAEESLRRAVELNANSAMAHGNLGVLLFDMARYDEAQASLERALRIDPGYLPAKANLALLWLLLGDFGRAWEFYTARRPVRNLRRNLWREPLPDDLSGKRILLLKEQGLGDEIFFLRFAPEVKRRGGEIIYLGDAKIAPIIRRVGFIDRVIGEAEEAGGIDMTLSVADLPYLVGMKSAADIRPPYPLPVEPERRSSMVARLERLGPAPYIGLTWRAGSGRPGLGRPGETFREIPRGRLAKALDPVKGTFVALQRKPEAGEIAALSQALGRTLHDLTDLNDALEDMLAALSLLDDYVGVSNTNVHLRAGTGRPSRVLIPHPPAYRWMASGDESPWFPGSAVYRQKVNGDWDGAFQALTKDLGRAFGGGG
ncbi:MAG: glycosyltransferase family protein [Proteobacteria bacterium]|nr:glycosyltransferase family protein [Pseudomonadota bacterium]